MRGVKVLNAGVKKTSNHDSGAGKVQTTDATVTPVLSIQTSSNVAYRVRVGITGRKIDSSKVAGYDIEGVFINNAGVLTQQGATTTLFNQATDGAWAVGFAISGTQIVVTVQGKLGDVVDWSAEYEAGVTF
jgi:hypothetical protein